MSGQMPLNIAASKKARKSTLHTCSYVRHTNRERESNIDFTSRIWFEQNIFYLKLVVIKD